MLQRYPCAVSKSIVVNEFIVCYIAGSCLPLLGPEGCLEHELAVKLEIEEFFVPQYLQVYCGFSLPSYSVCLPLLGPRGCREHEVAVKLDTLEFLVPQYLQ